MTDMKAALSAAFYYFTNSLTSRRTARPNFVQIKREEHNLHRKIIHNQWKIATTLTG